jgi:hypothetical protein
MADAADRITFLVLIKEQFTDQRNSTIYIGFIDTYARIMAEKATIFA